jgi:membrane carboxypeptidase/penicillin-binding protein
MKALVMARTPSRDNRTCLTPKVNVWASGSKEGTHTLICAQQKNVTSVLATGGTMGLESNQLSSCQTTAQVLLHLSHVLSDVMCASLIRSSAARYASRLGVPYHFLIQLFSIEDKRFAFHFGVDPVAIIRAVVSRLAPFPTVQGASTITQQLYHCLQKAGRARHPRTIEWKIKQSVWAVLAEARMTKFQILSEYLNHVYWGSSYFGLDSAALGYFDLTRNQLRGDARITTQ